LVSINRRINKYQYRQCRNGEQRQPDYDNKDSFISAYF
jgi:hypothetical protein